MDIGDIFSAVDYVEEHLTQHIDYKEVAKRAYSSSFHFQKAFSFYCGITLGEYIRRRRLSLAAAELIKGNVKVIDVALKYGYETPESFARAFCRFHGVLPSKAKGSVLNCYSRLSPKKENCGGGKMDCKIEEKPKRTLVGFKKHFYGIPYGEERVKQEDEFFCSTRAKQWLLRGASNDNSIDYGIIVNTDDGYDYYIAYELDEWTREHLPDKSIMGADLSTWGLKTIEVPKQVYAVFSTPKAKYPIKMYTELRKQIVNDWLPRSDFEFVDAPEIVEYHWRPCQGEWQKERHIQICLPIKFKA